MVQVSLINVGLINVLFLHRFNAPYKNFSLFCTKFPQHVDKRGAPTIILPNPEKNKLAITCMEYNFMRGEDFMPRRTDYICLPHKQLNQTKRIESEVNHVLSIHQDFEEVKTRLRLFVTNLIFCNETPF